MKSFLRPILAALVGLAVLVPAAHAGDQQISIMQDDDLLLYRGDDTRDRSLVTMRNLGVDAIRVTVLWEVVAERTRFSATELRRLRGSARERARRQNRRFRADNPRTYPAGNWDKYDNLVKKAQELGLRVYFSVTGPGPRWAHETAPPSQRRTQRTWKPRPGAYRQFVTALGRRYSGTYRDENSARSALPRVSFWSLWNEPNQAGWLAPQWERTRGGSTIAASPALFRRLHQFGREGLVRTGHGRDTILIGETAPLGISRRTARSPMRPKTFLRELACVDGQGDAYTGAAARARSCSDLRRRGGLAATGYAHHPYTRNVSPVVRSGGADAVTMANIGELGTLLDDLSAQSGGALPANLPLFMTEFGYETNPPDVVSGVALDQQAEFSNIGELIAFLNPRIQGQSQFLLRDVGPVRRHTRNSKAYWFTYQSGLFFLRGQPKPAATAYALPFAATGIGVNPSTGGRIARVWGQLRFRAKDRPPGSADQVQVECRPEGTNEWVAAGPPLRTNNVRGFFVGQVECPRPGAGGLRAVWKTPQGAPAVFSRRSNVG